MNTVAVLAPLVTALIAVCALLVGTIRWVWHQATNQAKQTNAINKNTEATEQLSDSFRVYADKADGHLLDHEKRITRLEDKRT